MQQQAAGIASYPDLAKIAPGALASIQNTYKDDLQFVNQDFGNSADPNQLDQAPSKHPNTKSVMKVDL